jgi:PEGA domain
VLRKRVAALAAVSIVTAVSTGCATITAPRTERVAVHSYPEGAEVRVVGVPQGNTPTSVEVEKRFPPTIQVSMTGYQPEECRLRTSPGTFYVVADVALCLVLFPFGCISFIDASGAWNELVSTTCNVSLKPRPDFAQIDPQRTGAPQQTSGR